MNGESLTDIKVMSAAGKSKRLEDIHMYVFSIDNRNVLLKRSQFAINRKERRDFFSSNCKYKRKYIK